MHTLVSAVETENGRLDIVGAISSKWAKGAGGPAGDEMQNLVFAPDIAAPITAVSQRKHDDDSTGRVHNLIVEATPILEAGARIIHPGGKDGAGIGEAGDPMFTLQSEHQHAVFTIAPGHGDPETKGDAHICQAETACTLDAFGSNPGLHQGGTMVVELQVFEARFARNGRGAPETVSPPLKAQRFRFSSR